jgi:hypothetical protein
VVTEEPGLRNADQNRRYRVVVAIGAMATIAAGLAVHKAGEAGKVLGKSRHSRTEETGNTRAPRAMERAGR